MSLRCSIIRERLGARQDYPSALRGLDPPSALPRVGNYGARPDYACRLPLRKLRLEIIDSELRSNGPEPFWSESRETLCRELRQALQPLSFHHSVCTGVPLKYVVRLKFVFR